MIVQVTPTIETMESPFPPTLPMPLPAASVEEEQVAQTYKRPSRRQFNVQGSPLENLAMGAVVVAQFKKGDPNRGGGFISYDYGRTLKVRAWEGNFEDGMFAVVRVTEVGEKLYKADLVQILTGEENLATMANLVQPTLDPLMTHFVDRLIAGKLQAAGCLFLNGITPSGAVWEGRDLVVTFKDIYMSRVIGAKGANIRPFAALLWQLGYGLHIRERESRPSQPAKRRVKPQQAN